jgi:hypothetical protein
MNQTPAKKRIGLIINTGIPCIGALIGRRMTIKPTTRN